MKKEVLDLSNSNVDVDRLLTEQFQFQTYRFHAASRYLLSLFRKMYLFEDFDNENKLTIKDRFTLNKGRGDKEFRYNVRSTAKKVHKHFGIEFSPVEILVIGMYFYNCHTKEDTSHMPAGWRYYLAGQAMAGINSLEDLQIVQANLQKQYQYRLSLATLAVTIFKLVTPKINLKVGNENFTDLEGVFLQKNLEDIIPHISFDHTLFRLDSQDGDKKYVVTFGHLQKFLDNVDLKNVRSLLPHQQCVLSVAGHVFNAKKLI